LKAPSPERGAEFAAAARRIVVERASAADVVAQFLRDTPREEWLSLADRPELQNNGALERLSREIDTALDRQPQDALPLSLLATKIADALPEDQYPAVVTAQIRAHAWKDRAQALSVVGNHAEALIALDRAEDFLSPFGTVAHDQAIVRLVRANVLQSLKDFDGSLELLAECDRVFRQHRDYRRALYTGINQANLYYRMKQFDIAREIYSRLVEPATRVADPTLLAAIHLNLGYCLVELDESIETNVHLSTAIALLNDLGNRVDAIRAELATGRLLIARGRTTEGLLQLRAARSHFFANGLAPEAGICALDLAAGLLTEGRDREAREMFDEAFREIGSLNERARAALEYLAAAFAAHDATPAVVHHVTEYLETLKTEPSLDFVALQ
jgi:tetratricopeptide (TPR) repeat protein